MTRPFSLSVVLAAGALSIAACAESQTEESQTEDAQIEVDASAETASMPSAMDPISEDAVARRVAELSSDAFAGRAPASPGGQAASAWIADEMARIGLEPAGDDGSYFQTVPLMRTRLEEDSSSLTIRDGDGAEIPLTFRDDIVYVSMKLQPEIAFEDSQLVFVGYGAVAPEYDWDDYGDLDYAGKTVVMLVNDPGYATQDPELFTGDAMTYYGRWTYKFEEAGRHGAAAALVIHETEPASYGWNVVEGGWTGDQFDLVRPDAGASRVGLEGWVSRSAAEQLFAAAGLDFETLKAAAQEPGFEPVVMDGLTASASTSFELENLDSRNVAGVLPGSERPDEYLLMMGHWDHLGAIDVEPGEDGVFNGAVDNATGVAGILTIAESLANAPTPPERSILAVAVTAEESGLLGSEYFGERPLVPLSQIVGGLNIDAMLPIGRARDIVVVGYGASELEDVLAQAAAAQDKVLTPDPNPSAGYFYRSDHISLSKRGVPMIYADGGEDLLEGGSAAGAAAAQDYRDNRYHAVSDEFDAATWDLSGMAEDLTIFRDFVAELANSEDWPNWRDGNEFRALRDAQRAAGD